MEVEFCYGVMWSVSVWFGLGGNGDSLSTEVVVELSSVEWGFRFESEIRILFYFSFGFSREKERRVCSVRAVGVFVEAGGGGIRASARGCMFAKLFCFR